MKESDSKSCKRQSVGGGGFDRFYVYFNITLFTVFHQGQEIRNREIVKDSILVHVYICRCHLLLFLPTEFSSSLQGAVWGVGGG